MDSKERVCANLVKGYDSGDSNADLCLESHALIDHCPKDCPYFKLKCSKCGGKMVFLPARRIYPDGWVCPECRHEEK